MRTLLCVPVIHTMTDLGSLAGTVARTFRQRYGAEKWKAHVRSVEGFWKEIDRRIMALPLDFGRVRVYQDGLPVCGREEEIARDLAQRGSANHLLVARLLDRGAHLMGTEDPQLLLREYRLLKEQLAQLNGPSPDASNTHAAQSGAVLEERDRFIARRIEETLADGETGILFLGLLHQVPRYLPPTITVEFPVPLAAAAGRPGGTEK